MARDYYLILGVPLDAAPGEIRSAFRRLALRHHPDRHEESNAEAFRRISEAYGVLSDPVRRARYDRELHRGTWHPEPVPDPTRDPEPEPLISEPMRIPGEPGSVRPSYESLLEHLVRNFEPAEEPKADRNAPLDFELILSSEEAERGVLVPFEVPVLSICFGCGGTGRDWLFPCDDCDGRGRIVDRDTVSVRVPAGVRDGTVIEASLETVGIRNLWLRVHIRVTRS